MKDKQKNLIDSYLETAPIGQAGNVESAKNRWMRLNFLKIFPTNKTARILEIGPGRGELLKFLKSLGYKDISSIEISKGVCKHIKQLGFNCQLVEDDLDYLKTRKSTFDLIVLNDVLEHVPKEQVIPLIQSIHQSLTKRGKVIIKVPNAQSPHFGIGLYGDLTHAQAFTETSFIQLFRASGFEKFELKAEIIPHSASPLSLLSAFVIRPLYFFWVRMIRVASGHSSPKILTQAIIAIAVK